MTYESKGNSMLYLEMNKALYVLLQSALIFYKKLRKDLKEYGLGINTYDPFVASATIKSHQMTVMWHVENLKVYHKEPY